MKTPKLQITNATVKFGETTVFSRLNLALLAGKWTGLIGASGIGKSSLLRMIAGLYTAKEASADFAIDNPIPLHQQVAYMAQTDLLLPWCDVLNNTLLGFKLRHHSKTTYAAAYEKAKSLLTQVGLGDVIHHYPHELSGGMRQRVALVRTLIEDKPIVLMDEPFSALDAISRFKLQNLAAEFLKQKTVFFITHDPSEALRLAHVIYIMHGKPAQLKLITEFASDTPRQLNNLELATWQAQLFQELTNAQGEE